MALKTSRPLVIEALRYNECLLGRFLDSLDYKHVIHGDDQEVDLAMAIPDEPTLDELFAAMRIVRPQDKKKVQKLSRLFAIRIASRVLPNAEGPIPGNNSARQAIAETVRFALGESKSENVDAAYGEAESLWRSIDLADDLLRAILTERDYYQIRAAYYAVYAAMAASSRTIGPCLRVSRAIDAAADSMYFSVQPGRFPDSIDAREKFSNEAKELLLSVLAGSVTLD